MQEPLGGRRQDGFTTQRSSTAENHALGEMLTGWNMNSGKDEKRGGQGLVGGGPALGHY